MSRTASSQRKTKKSYTLSAESVAFLEAMRKKRRGTSASSVLDEILQAVHGEERKASLERAVAGYYASLSHRDAEEQVNWGKFALGEFPKESG